MFVSRDPPHGVDKGGPRLWLLSKHAPPFSRDLVEPAAPLVGLLDPGAPDPSPLLEAIEQRIEGIDVERQVAARPCVDQLAQLVAVPGPGVEEREDEQLRRSAFQLAIERARVDI